jgi:kumamolisin
VSTDGTPTNASDGNEGEVMLDIEVVAGVCPKSTIVAHFADFTEQGWITILDAVMQDSTNNPGVVSISWGFAEDAFIWTDTAMNEVNQSLLEAAHLGITVCVASGDDGSSDAISDGLAHVDFPGSSPYVLSVGGTTIPSKTGNSSDIVWKEGDGLRSDGGGSTGGGVSASFDRPSWQSSINIPSVNPGAKAGRIVPDVAANADWDASPYLLVVDGNAEPNGGTSAATPLWASLIALINAKGGQRLGYVTPLLYQPASSGTGTVGQQGCVDITSGDNNTDQIGGYFAAVGYDAVSGWGTPNGVALASALSGQVAAAGS